MRRRRSRASVWYPSLTNTPHHQTNKNPYNLSASEQKIRVQFYPFQSLKYQCDKYAIKWRYGIVFGLWEHWSLGSDADGFHGSFLYNFLLKWSDLHWHLASPRVYGITRIRQRGQIRQPSNPLRVGDAHNSGRGSPRRGSITFIKFAKPVHASL